MPRYADPCLCPDCRSRLAPGADRCLACGLRLTGPLPGELFATLTRADELLAVLRGLSAPPPVPSVEEGGHARLESPAPHFRLTGAAVPRILLGLGAVCLLVAAAVFSVVAWSSLGLGGRTAVLGTVTVVVAATASWSVARALGAAAEALTAVTAGLVVLDVAGAARAGWLGSPTPAGLTTLVCVALLVLGATAAVGARRTARPHLYAAEITATLALVTGSVSTAALLHASAPVTELTGLLVAGAVTGAAYAGRLRILAGSGAVLAAAWWAALLLDGLLDALAHPSLAGLVEEARGWPVLVAIGILALPVALPRLPQWLRTTALGGVLALLAVVPAIPAVDEPLEVGTLVAVVTIALASVGAGTMPGRWAAATAAPAGLAGAATLTVLAAQAEVVARRLMSDAVWSQPAGLPLPALPDIPGSPGLIVPSLLALVAGAVAMARLVGLRIGREWLAGPVTGSVTVGAAATTASYAVPRGWVLAILVLGTMGALAWGLPRRGPVLCAALLAAAAVAVALPSAGLNLVALASALALAATVDLAGDPALRPAAQAVLPVTLGLLVADAAGLAGIEDDPRALLVVVAAGLIALVRPTAPSAAGATLTALVALATGSGELSWLALDLVAAGALTLAAAVLHRRPMLAWAGTGLVLVGGWVHLAETGVTSVDAYTLPPAVVLLALGALRMHRHGTESVPALAPGLALAMAPSLVLALGEPVSLRAVVLGLACAALVVTGTSLRLAAPLLFGAGAGLMLVLRQSAYADAVPQWVVIGAVGVLLTVLGITWERRLHDLRLAAGYLRALR